MKKPHWWQTLFGSPDYPEERAMDTRVNESKADYKKIGIHKKKVKETGKPDRWEMEWTLWTYHKILRGEIEADRSKRQKGVWSMDGNAIYITCPLCAAIMNATNHRIKEDGEISPCVVCPKCDKHVFMQLVGWNMGIREEVRSEKEKADDERWQRELEEWRRKYDKDNPTEAGVFWV